MVLVGTTLVIHAHLLVPVKLTECVAMGAAYRMEFSQFTIFLSSSCHESNFIYYKRDDVIFGEYCGWKNGLM